MNNGNQETSSQNELVFLIHGTFAGTDSDEGRRWWQRGSPFWCQLEQFLPEDITMGDVFHWEEGPNSYRARVEAGGVLLNKLIELEKTRQGYHLVGHSHGGSIIWECLRQASFSRSGRNVSSENSRPLKLPNLKSWTTVGTPFIDFAPKLLLRRPITETKPSSLRKRRILSFLLPDFFMRIYGLWALGVVASGSIAPFFFSWGFASEVYSADPNISVGTLVLFALLGFAMPMLFFFPIALLAGAYLMRVAEAKEASRERLLMNNIVKEFGPKWLGIYSEHDEAIASIKASIDLNLSLIPKRENTQIIFFSDKIFRSIHWLRRRINFFYNLFVPMLGNSFMAAQISRAVQGSDRPGCVAVATRTHPSWSDGFSMPIPKDVDAQLVALADRRAAELIPQLRALLFSFDGGPLHLTLNQDTDPTSGLVHNNYFDVKEIVHMIANHIRMMSGCPSGHHEHNDAAVKWIRAFKTNFAKHIH